VKEFPARAPLDAAAPANPVALRRIDGHALWVNGAALRAAGVTAATPDPDGGSIVRDARGEPTGVLVDNAMALVEDKIPAAAPEVIRRRVLLGARTAAAAGLTAVHDMGIDASMLAAYRQLAAEGALPVRVRGMLDGDKLMAGRHPDRDEDGTALFVLAGVKLWADGALGSRGAALLEPYDDDPGNRGLVLTSRAEVERIARATLAGGWQLAVHAIGDRANREVLDAFAAAGVKPAHRYRIEHAQVVAPEDLRRFGELGIVASMQATHATSDMPWAEARVGARRLQGAYAWRSMLMAGAPLVGGSDFPVEEVAPLLGLWAATTRQDAAGKPEGGWLPEQKLTLHEALHTYTVAPARAAFAEHRRGRLVPGFVADVTVFDRELLVERLLATRVDMTLLGGRVVYERPR
jgi:predicted amidohydrolase YtcJ